MLRTLLAISLISIAVSCAHKDAGKALRKSPRTTDHETQSLSQRANTFSDSAFYVGYVDYFPETREFYTALYYRDGHEYPDEDLLESKLDSVIAFEDDWGRERLPMEDARELLVLSGLDTLLVFDRENQLVCTCPLNRVEYLWNGLESNFIAVFKADRDFGPQTGELYGVSASLPHDHFQKLSSREVRDANLNSSIIKALNISNAHNWHMRHYRIDPAGATYSIISSSTESGESRSYLAVSDNEKAEILNEEQENYQYLNILPVPILMNGKPLLLISAGYPSSDVLWDYLAGFDGKSYEAIEYNRLPL